MELNSAVLKRARRACGLALLLSASPLLSGHAHAQRRVTLEEAVAAAQANAPSVAIARADSAVARAEVSAARVLPNPVLALDYSQSPPTKHVIAEQPLDFPWIRNARIRAAETALGAAGLVTQAERATIRYRAEVAYVRAAGTAEIERLSRQNVANVTELVNSVRARQAAGDASELDVALAQVTLGQLRSTALTDSLAVISAAIDLQVLMGIPGATAQVLPADSLAAIPFAAAAVSGSAGATLRVAAAQQSLAARQGQLIVAQYGRFPVPSLRAGVEWGDPSTGDNSKLKTYGVSIPLPIFNRGGADIAIARANSERARAELAGVERETSSALATAQRQREIATARLAVDRATVQDAQRVATLSLIAYREGAYPLATVLDAQRAARDALRQYLDDLITSRTVEAAFRLAQTAGGATPP
jgi:cobalt-zinc-cadmium efflux system outer membrane protein